MASRLTLTNKAQTIRRHDFARSWSFGDYLRVSPVLRLAAPGRRLDTPAAAPLGKLAAISTPRTPP